MVTCPTVLSGKHKGRDTALVVDSYAMATVFTLCSSITMSYCITCVVSPVSSVLLAQCAVCQVELVHYCDPFVICQRGYSLTTELETLMYVLIISLSGETQS